MSRNVFLDWKMENKFQHDFSIPPGQNKPARALIFFVVSLFFFCIVGGLELLSLFRLVFLYKILNS